MMTIILIPKVLNRTTQIQWWRASSQISWIDIASSKNHHLWGTPLKMIKWTLPELMSQEISSDSLQLQFRGRRVQTKSLAIDGIKVQSIILWEDHKEVQLVISRSDCKKNKRPIWAAIKTLKNRVSKQVQTIHFHSTTTTIFPTLK